MLWLLLGYVGAAVPSSAEVVQPPTWDQDAVRSARERTAPQDGRVERRYWGVLRSLVAIGGGGVGLGGVFAVQGDLWFFDCFAAGAAWTALGQGEILGQSQHGSFAGLRLAWRTQPTRHYFEAALGVGYGFMAWQPEPCLLDSCDCPEGSCWRPQPWRSRAVLFSPEVSAPFHFWALEIAPLFRVDVPTRGSTSFAVGLALGIAPFSRQ